MALRPTAPSSLPHPVRREGISGSGRRVQVARRVLAAEKRRTVAFEVTLCASRRVSKDASQQEPFGTEIAHVRL